ncbi:MAG: tetratricopeptide repeat protein [Longimicrobiales bacterium]
MRAREGHPKTRVWVLALAALAVAAFANSLTNGFAYDDVSIIGGNARVHALTDGVSLADLRAIWLTPYWPTDSGQMLGAYRPLTIFLFAVQWVIAGGATWLFHALNIALHVVVTLFGFAVLRALGTRESSAFIGAGIFAVHPVHTEVIANVVGQAELVAASAVLGACLIYLRARASNRNATLAIAFLYLLGMLAKEHAIVLPALLVALAYVAGHMAAPHASVPEHARALGRYLRARATLYAALGVAAAAFLALRVQVLGSITSENSAPQLPYLQGDLRLYSAFRAWPEFVRLLFFPFDLSSDYSPAVVLPVEDLTGLALLGLLLMAAVVVLAAATPLRPRLGLPPAWFLITILPTSNLFFPIGVLLAERTLYLPSFAVAIITAFATDAVHARAGRRAHVAIAAVAAAVILTFAGRSVLRNPDWRDTDAVMDALIRDHPESYRAQWYAAYRAYVQGDLDLAAYHWELGYRLWGGDAQFVRSYAAFLLERGQVDRAVELAEHAVELRPRLRIAVVLLAAAYLRADRFTEAAAITDTLIARYGPDAENLEIRARALTGLGSSRAPGAWIAAFDQGVEGWSERFLYAHSLIAAGDTMRARTALDRARALAEASGDTAAVAIVGRSVRALREQASGPG